MADDIDSVVLVPVSSETGAPASNTEITSAMIWAGINVLSPRVVEDLHDGWIRPSVVVEMVFSAMLRASK